jgi:hypothetical protein
MAAKLQSNKFLKTEPETAFYPKKDWFFFHKKEVVVISTKKIEFKSNL